MTLSVFKSLHWILPVVYSIAVMLAGTVLAATALQANDREAIEAMIAAGEAEKTLDLLDKRITDLASSDGWLSEHLVEPLVLKGDALYALGRFDAALTHYDDARSIQRRQYGLHDLRQIEVLYKEADTFFAQERFTRANDRQEYAFSIYRRKYGTSSTDILPGLFNLADWYLDTNNIFTARGLYETALTRFNDDPTFVQESRTRALRGLATTYRLERFRPPHFISQVDKFTPRPYDTINHSDHYFATLNEFSKGEEALLELVKIYMGTERFDSVILADAKLELADWYLLFEQFDKASVVYRDIWDSLRDTPQYAFIEENMSTPHILYKPTPHNPQRPKQSSKIPLVELEGRIEITLTVTEAGTTEDIEQVSSNPGKILARATRQAAAASRYRPAFIDGTAIQSENVQFIHTFPYYSTSETRKSQRSTKNTSFRSSK